LGDLFGQIQDVFFDDGVFYLRAETLHMG
jgi:hypothetical protein